tara:strand:+ start:1168 stop:1443 length:276 start_codon:yes stop_codon:yes gene_type:complete
MTNGQFNKHGNFASDKTLSFTVTKGQFINYIKEGKLLNKQFDFNESLSENFRMTEPIMESIKSKLKISKSKVGIHTKTVYIWNTDLRSILK